MTLALTAAMATAACADNASGNGVTSSAPAPRRPDQWPQAPPGHDHGRGLSKQIYLPYMLDAAAGLLRKAGVNVKLVDEPAGGDAT